MVQCAKKLFFTEPYLLAHFLWLQIIPVLHSLCLFQYIRVTNWHNVMFPELTRHLLLCSQHQSCLSTISWLLLLFWLMEWFLYFLCTCAHNCTALYCMITIWWENILIRPHWWGRSYSSHSPIIINRAGQ